MTIYRVTAYHRGHRMASYHTAHSPWQALRRAQFYRGYKCPASAAPLCSGVTVIGQ